MSKIIIEKAKNGKDTCKIVVNHKTKYIYSKYKPNSLISEEELSRMNKEKIAVLIGGGLGYEYELLTLLFRDVLIYEGNSVFKEYLLSKYENIRFVEEIPQGLEYEIIYNSKLIQFSRESYKINLKQVSKERILIIEHPTLSKDWTRAFLNMGYEVFSVSQSENLETIINFAYEQKITIIGSINYYPGIEEKIKGSHLTYFAWVVDTPYYTLYKKENLMNTNTFMFIYDDSIKKALQRKGIPNVYYLPVASNPVRFEKILEDVDYLKDISFLGSCCGHNEVLNFFYPKVSERTKEIVDSFVDKQNNSKSFILNHTTLSSNLLSLLEDESGVEMQRIDLLETHEYGGFLFGRYHSFKERLRILEKIHRKFQNVAIYGPTDWVNHGNENIKKIYKGFAENEEEMIRVFKSSFINLNITRSFVEEGLPMRVFDVLASSSFLITNRNSDIEKYFIDKEDLVIYDNEEHLLELIDYYLKNPQEIARIAKNGYQKVKENHTFEHRVQSMMNIYLEG